MIIKKQKPIEFVNKCECQVDYRCLEQAILSYSRKPVARLKKIFMYGSYPAVSVYGEKIHVHRIIGWFMFPSVSIKSMVVHHGDDNKLNANYENLSVMFQGPHISNHLAGRKLSLIHRQRIGAANRKRKGVKLGERLKLDSVAISGMIDEGTSINKIAKRFNVSWRTIKNRIYEEVTDVASDEVAEMG